jgi:hypothetical protein
MMSYNGVLAPYFNRLADDLVKALLRCLVGQ